MKLTVLGKYGPFPKGNGGTSSYLLNCEDKTVLLDAGESSFSRLVNIMPPEKLDAIVLTHSHFDHICDAGVFNYYFERLSRSAEKFEKPLLFYFDDGKPSLFPVKNSPYFNLVEIYDGFKYKLGKNELTFNKVAHPVICHAVTVKENGRTFVYTGDTNLFDGLSDIIAPSDAFLADGGFLSADWTDKKPHMSVRQVSELSKKCGNKAIISHLNPFYTEREIFEEAKSGGGDFIIAQEGETYTI